MTPRNRHTYPAIVLLLVFLGPSLFVLISSLGATGNKAALLGQLAGLTALSWLSLAILLPARLRSLERTMGQDRLVNFHRIMACLVFMSVVAHVVLVNVGGLLPLRADVPSWALVLGQLTALGILGGVIGAALQSSIFPDYNKWRYLHRSLALLVVTATVHGLFLGTHLRFYPMNGVYLFLLVFALLLTAYRRFYIPQNLTSYEVAKVQSAADKVLSITLKPEKTAIEEPEPGQLAYLTMSFDGTSPEEHPFTISSHKDNELTFTVKQSGDFTSKIGSLKEDAKVLVEGPYGCFGHNLSEAKSFLFVAGGVGITPLFAMYNHLKANNDERRGLFITAARHRSDLIFGQELHAPFYNWQILTILSAPDEEWQGAQGHIDKAFLEENAKELLKEAQVYVCGPDAMMASVTKALQELSVSGVRIQSERFTFP